ncbi:hypothetical protein PoB_002065600 [Plakobranchus ocellatus]|uniref:Uncharacterized protein n=1 Tax=Plakobranchus ocellatus TaxID=259542 RepID=A0AAV3ZHP3_9GAST|nr:hypothetical protein PoB_002065600 [Plakobranchus ocellatus]
MASTKLASPLLLFILFFLPQNQAVAGMNWRQEAPADFRATLMPPAEHKNAVKEMTGVSKYRHGVHIWRQLHQRYQETAVEISKKNIPLEAE